MSSSPTTGSQPNAVIGFLRVVFFGLLIFAYGILANLVFLLSAVLWPFSPAAAYEMNSRTAFALWTSMQWVFEDLHQGEITYSGDEIPEGESALVISNHVSYSDYYLIQGLAKRKGMLPYCRYFSKFALLYQLPIFGLSLYLIGMVMVKRDWTRDQKSAGQAFSNIKTNKQKIWLVSYLEGTRLGAKKVQESQAFAKKRDLPILSHVLLPRTKGFIAAVSQLRESHVKCVYDMTLAYLDDRGRFQKPTDLYQVHANSQLSPPRQFHLNVKRFLIADLPTDEKKLAQWAEERFAAKDKLLQNILDNHKSTGKLRPS